MSVLDNILIKKYLTMVGYGNIINNSGNTTIIGSASINSNLYVSSSGTLQNNTSINSSLNILGNSLINGNVSLNSSIYVSGNTIINGSNTVLNNLYINGSCTLLGNLDVSSNTIINNLTTINNNLYINNSALFNNISVSSINPVNQILNINSNLINIGNPNSIINIMGTSNYIASQNFMSIDKSIVLNLNASTGTGFDIGNSSGIEILGTGGTGFIQTSDDAKRFIICPPINGRTMYIATTDTNYNMVVSGITTLNNNVSLLSQLYVAGNSTFNNNIIINSNLNISSNSLFSNFVTVGSSLFVYDNSVFNGNVTMANTLNINSNMTILGNTTLVGSLLVSGSAILGKTTVGSKIYVQGNTIINNLSTIGSTLNVLGNTNINNAVTVNSNLLINKSAIFHNTTILSNLNVSNTTNIQGSMNIRSNLSISGNVILCNNLTLGSQFANLNILSSIISKLPEYPDNISAVNAGVPIWGWYRTGGILKIRLNNIPPIVYLSGQSTITVNSGLSFTDLGAYALDYYNNSVLVYMSSILSGNTNLLSSNILISGSNTLIATNNPLPVGNYTATYQATDDSGNIGYNYRSINAISLTFPIYYNSTNIAGRARSGSPLIFNADGSMYLPIYSGFWLTSTAISNNNISFNKWTAVIRVIGDRPAFGQYFVNLDPTAYALSNSFVMRSSTPSIQYQPDGINWYIPDNIIQAYSDNSAAAITGFNNINSNLTVGIYIEITYKNSTLSIIYRNLAGTILYNYNKPNNYTFINNITPFSTGIGNGDNGGAQITCLKGMLFDLSATATYINFINLFGS